MMTTHARRAFLRTFAGVTFASAATRFFVRTSAAAVFPTRFLFLFSQHGRDPESRCTGTGSQFSLGPALQALAPFKNKLLVVDGLENPDHQREEHPDGRCSMLTAWPADRGQAQGPSIDRLIADRLAGGRSVYAGIERPILDPDELNLSISWHGARAPNAGFLEGPTAVQNALFSGASMPRPPVTSKPDENAAAAAANEAAMRDYLVAELRRLERVAPKAELEKLQLHLRALDQVLIPSVPQSEPTTPLRSCEAPGNPPRDDTDRISLLLANAMACGLVRVAVHSLGRYEPHHEYSHWENQADHDRLKAADRQMTERVATMLGYLDGFPEGNGTLLDNTVVIWSSEVSGLHGTGVHDVRGMPYVLAGGLGGRLKTGQRVVVNGRKNGELYRTIATQMGVGDVAGYGAPGFAAKELSEILA